MDGRLSQMMGGRMAWRCDIMPVMDIGSLGKVTGCKLLLQDAEGSSGMGRGVNA